MSEKFRVVIVQDGDDETASAEVRFTISENSSQDELFAAADFAQKTGNEKLKKIINNIWCIQANKKTAAHYENQIAEEWTNIEKLYDAGYNPETYSDLRNMIRRIIDLRNSKHFFEKRLAEHRAEIAMLNRESAKA